MNKKNVLVLVALLLLLVVSYLFLQPKKEQYIISKNDKKDVFETAKDFSSCAGFFDAMSWLSERVGRPESSTEFKNRYRGWYLAGAYMLFSTAAIKDWQKSIEYIKATSEVQSQRYKAQLEGDFEYAQKEINKDFEEKCKPLIEYQESLVAQMREDIANRKDKLD